MNIVEEIQVITFTRVTNTGVILRFFGDLKNKNGFLDFCDNKDIY